MTRASFRQTDIERIIKAAKKTGATVQIDLRSLVVTVSPGMKSSPKSVTPQQQTLARDGQESWDDDKDWAYYQPGQSAGSPPPPIQPELDNREFGAMIRLVELGVGGRLHPAGTRGFGPVTQRKLAERGYIEIIHMPGQKLSDDEVSLTQKGLADWKAQKAYVKKYPHF